MGVFRVCVWRGTWGVRNKAAAAMDCGDAQGERRPKPCSERR